MKERKIIMIATPEDKFFQPGTEVFPYDCKNPTKCERMLVEDYDALICCRTPACAIIGKSRRTGELICQELCFIERFAIKNEDAFAAWSIKYNDEGAHVLRAALKTPLFYIEIVANNSMYEIWNPVYLQDSPRFKSFEEAAEYATVSMISTLQKCIDICKNNAL